jgi:hypothetical protein
MNRDTNTSAGNSTMEKPGYFSRIIADALGLLVAQQVRDDIEVSVESIEENLEFVNGDAMSTSAVSNNHVKDIIRPHFDSDTVDKNRLEKPSNPISRKINKRNVPLEVSVRDRFSNSTTSKKSLISQHQSIDELGSGHYAFTEPQIYQPTLDEQVSASPTARASEEASLRNTSVKTSKSVEKTPGYFTDESSLLPSQRQEQKHSELSDKGELTVSRDSSLVDSRKQDSRKQDYRSDIIGNNQRFNRPEKNQSPIYEPENNDVVHQHKRDKHQLHIGQVNIKVIDAQQPKSSDKPHNILGKKLATAAKELQGTDSRTFLRTL